MEKECIDEQKSIYSRCLDVKLKEFKLRKTLHKDIKLPFGGFMDTWIKEKKKKETNYETESISCA